ncbi:MAG: hypothetical protein KGM49_13860, partial [Sphingomonadales bacterium]|nr:hypothetical protein [Sphingomonadales bacterium]
MQLSPQLLKQFGLITFIITALIAMFANGEQAKVEATLQARAAQNHLLEVEAKKLGTRKLVAAMKIQPEQSGEGFEKLNDKDPVSSPPSSVSSGSGAARFDSRDVITLPDGRQAVAIEKGPDGKPRPIKSKAPTRPTPEQLRKLREQSRARSGKA